MTVEVRRGEERRRRVLNERLLSASEGTQKTITSRNRSPVTGSNASGRGFRKKINDFEPT
jgi:hypothetical protein